MTHLLSSLLAVILLSVVCAPQLYYHSATWRVQSGGTGLWLIDSQGNITTSAWPSNGGAVHQYNFNSLVVAGGALHVLATSKIWKLTAVGGEWSYHCDMGQDCVGIGYFDGVGIIVSTKGTGAQIMKVAL